MAGGDLPIVLVWDRLDTHVSHVMRELIAERSWLTVFPAPRRTHPDPDPAERIRTHAEHGLVNLAVVALTVTRWDWMTGAPQGE
ncbi:hypothetical protein AB0N77_10940 [Streptomyces misionensis]